MNVQQYFTLKRSGSVLLDVQKKDLKGYKSL